MLNLTENVYASAPFDGNLMAAVDWPEDRLDITIPVRPIVAADPFAALTEAGPTSGLSLGRTYLGDVAVDHLALRNPAFDWEIWLEATPQALPRRVSLRRRGDDGGARVILDFAAWNLAAELPDSAFAFTAPPGATETTMVLRPQ